MKILSLSFMIAEGSFEQSGFKYPHMDFQKSSILFIDHLSALKRKMAIQKIKKSKKNIRNNE